IEHLATPFAQALEHLAHAHETVALAVAHALLEQAAQRRVEVAVVQEVVGDLVEECVRIEVEAALRAVPARVPERRLASAAVEPHEGRVPRRSPGRARHSSSATFRFVSTSAITNASATATLTPRSIS